jgi:hypothetical protein
VRKLATADRVPQDQVSALEGVQQAPLREEVIGRGPPPAGSTPGSSSACPAAAPRPSAPQLGLVVRRPEVLDVPRPSPRQVHELNRRPARLGLHRPAMRHSTRQLYGPSLVRKFGTYKEKNCRPAHRRISPGSNCGPTQVLQPPPGRSHGREPECALTAAKSGLTAVTRRTYGKALSSQRRTQLLAVRLKVSITKHRFTPRSTSRSRTHGQVTGGQAGQHPGRPPARNGSRRTVVAPGTRDRCAAPGLAGATAANGQLPENWPSSGQIHRRVAMYVRSLHQE